MKLKIRRRDKSTEKYQGTCPKRDPSVHVCKLNMAKFKF